MEKFVKGEAGSSVWTIRLFGEKAIGDELAYFFIGLA